MNQGLWALVCVVLSARLFIPSVFRRAFGRQWKEEGEQVPGVKGHCNLYPPPSPPCYSGTRQSPRCACSSTPPGRSWAGWPEWAPRWTAPGCGWAGPAAVDPKASSRGSSACAPGWRTRPPAGLARNTPSSGPPGRCSWSAHRRACRWAEGRRTNRGALRVKLQIFLLSYYYYYFLLPESKFDFWYCLKIKSFFFFF